MDENIKKMFLRFCKEQNLYNELINEIDESLFSFEKFKPEQWVWALKVLSINRNERLIYELDFKWTILLCEYYYKIHKCITDELQNSLEASYRFCLSTNPNNSNETISALNCAYIKYVLGK